MDERMSKYWGCRRGWKGELLTQFVEGKAHAKTIVFAERLPVFGHLERVPIDEVGKTVFTTESDAIKGFIARESAKIAKLNEQIADAREVIKLAEAKLTQLQEPTNARSIKR